MTLRLDPAELGQLQIRIDRPADAPVRVEIVVEREETLTLLLRDQVRLDHTLTQAGLPPDGRSVTFQLSTAPTSAPSADSAGAFLGQGSTSHAGQFAQDDGSAGGGTRRSRSGTPSGAGSPEGANLGGSTRWLRAGLDITA